MSTISGGIPLFTPRAGGSGGGGGGVASIQWYESGVAPERAIENNIEVYKFDVTGVGQNLYGVFKLPESFVSGTKINLHLNYYSPDTSGTVLIRAQATALVALSSEMNSTTYQRTSTNTAFTMTGSYDNVLLFADIDLTDTNGQIGGVPLGSEYLIVVRLYRDTDTATSNVRVILNSAEVVFT